MEELQKEVAVHAKVALFGDTMRGEELKKLGGLKKRNSSVSDTDWGNDRATVASFKCKSEAGRSASTVTEESSSFKIRLNAGQTLLAGSPNYVDPLIVRSERFDETSDVFSFGVIMLECLCGMRVSVILATPGYS